MWQGPPEYANAPWGGDTAPALYTVPTSSVLPEYTAITPIRTARTRVLADSSHITHPDPSLKDTATVPSSFLTRPTTGRSPAFTSGQQTPPAPPQPGSEAKLPTPILRHLNQPGWTRSPSHMKPSEASDGVTPQHSTQQLAVQH